MCPKSCPEHKTRSTWKSDSSIGHQGFNEIMFEDLQGTELVFMQAEKDLRKLVKNDETIFVGNDRQKWVLHNELETTGENRTEVTGVNRTEIIEGNRTTIIGEDALKVVQGDELEITEGKMMVVVGDQDIVVKQDKRERVEGSSHFKVRGKQSQKIDGKYSLSVGADQHVRVTGNLALDASQDRSHPQRWLHPRRRSDPRSDAERAWRLHSHRCQRRDDSRDARPHQQRRFGRGRRRLEPRRSSRGNRGCDRDPREARARKHSSHGCAAAGGWSPCSACEKNSSIASR